MARVSPSRSAPIVLGVAGLSLSWASPPSRCGQRRRPRHLGLSPRTILSAYGAVIASFLGGIRWGAAAARNAGNGDYLVAIIPSLVAWAAMAAPAPWDLRILGGLVLAWGFIDQDLSRRGLTPLWLGRLRLVLSGVAGAALLVAA